MKRDTNAATNNVDDTIPDSAISSSEPTKHGRRPGVRKAVPPTERGPVPHTTAEAARIRRVTDDALRKRLDRSERKGDRTIEFQLGGYIVTAFKLGSHWRYEIKPR